MLRILWTNQTRDPIVFWVRTVVVWSFKWSSPQPFGNSSNIVNVSGPSATVITHLPPKLFGPHEREMLQIERSCSSLSLWIGPTQTSLACSSRILLTHYIPVGHLHIQHCSATALHPFDYESSGDDCPQRGSCNNGQAGSRQAQAKVFFPLLFSCCSSRGLATFIQSVRATRWRHWQMHLGTTRRLRRAHAYQN